MECARLSLEKRKWWEDEFEQIIAGRPVLLSLRNIHYVYAEPGRGSIGPSAASGSEATKTSNASK
jgi:hypothetical protein